MPIIASKAFLSNPPAITMKRFFQLLSGIVLSAILAYACLFYYSVELSPSARIGKQNEWNSYKVKPGMSASQAFHIMGSGKEKRMALNGDTIYSYVASPISSNSVILIINKDEKVTLIGHGD